MSTDPLVVAPEDTLGEVAREDARPRHRLGGRRRLRAPDRDPHLARPAARLRRSRPSERGARARVDDRRTCRRAGFDQRRGGGELDERVRDPPPARRRRGAARSGCSASARLPARRAAAASASASRPRFAGARLRKTRTGLWLCARSICGPPRGRSTGGPPTFDSTPQRVEGDQPAMASYPARTRRPHAVRDELGRLLDGRDDAARPHGRRRRLLRAADVGRRPRVARRRRPARRRLRARTAAPRPRPRDRSQRRAAADELRRRRAGERGRAGRGAQARTTRRCRRCLPATSSRCT